MLEFKILQELEQNAKIILMKKSNISLKKVKKYDIF